MPKRTVKKAELIRNALKQHGSSTRNRDIIDFLAQSNVAVSPAQVSNIKAALRTSGEISVPSDRTIALGALMAAKRFVEQLGSIDAAKRVIDVFERLR